MFKIFLQESSFLTDIMYTNYERTYDDEGARTTMYDGAFPLSEEPSIAYFNEQILLNIEIKTAVNMHRAVLVSQDNSKNNADLPFNLLSSKLEHSSVEYRWHLQYLSDYFDITDRFKYYDITTSRDLNSEVTYLRFLQSSTPTFTQRNVMLEPLTDMSRTKPSSLQLCSFIDVENE